MHKGGQFVLGGGEKRTGETRRYHSDFNKGVMSGESAFILDGSRGTDPHFQKMKTDEVGWPSARREQQRGGGKVGRPALISGVKVLKL